MRYITIISLFLMLSCSPESSDVANGNEKTRVTLQTDWYPQPEHAGFYTAELDLLFQANDLEVSIRPGANIKNIPQMVATGRIEFGIGTSDNVFTAISRGAPLIALFPYFQRDPQCIMVHESSDVFSLEDLDGRVLMINPGVAYVQYLGKKLGVKPQLVPLDYSLARFIADPEFAQQCFLTSEPYYLREQGIDVRLLPLANSGFNPYRIAYTNRDFYENNREVVRAFTAASLEGWRTYMESDGTAVHAYLATLNPQQTPAFTSFTKQAMEQYQLISGTRDKGESLGNFDRKRLSLHLQHLSELQLLDRELDIETVVAWELQDLAQVYAK